MTPGRHLWRRLAGPLASRRARGPQGPVCELLARTDRVGAVPGVPGELLDLALARGRTTSADAALARLVPRLADARGAAGAHLALACGALIEQGAAAGPAVAPLLDGLHRALLALPPADGVGPEDRAGDDAAWDDALDREGALVSWWALAVRAALTGSRQARATARQHQGLVDLLTGPVGDLVPEETGAVLDLVLSPDRERFTVLQPHTRDGAVVVVDDVVSVAHLQQGLFAALVPTTARGAPLPALFGPGSLVRLEQGLEPEPLHRMVGDARPADIGTVAGVRVVVLGTTPEACLRPDPGRHPMPPDPVQVERRFGSEEYDMWRARTVAELDQEGGHGR